MRPSGFDLWYTPVAGLLLGEARYFLWSEARTVRDRNWRGVLTALLDPFGELEGALGTPC